MKNIILSLVIALVSTSIVNAECVNGSCSRGPVKTAGAVALSTTKRIVTYPFRLVNKARVNRINRLSNR